MPAAAASTVPVATVVAAIAALRVGRDTFGDIPWAAAGYRLPDSGSTRRTSVAAFPADKPAVRVAAVLSAVGASVVVPAARAVSAVRVVVP